MSWSIYVWTLLSQSNRVYVIASCVGPCQRPLRNQWWSKLFACAPDSSRHPGCWWYRAQTGPDGVHKPGSQDLRLRNPCWQSASMLSKAKCLLMLLTNICSRVLQQMQVNDTGPYFAASYFSPFLKTWDTFACHQSSWTLPWAKDSL